MELYIGCSGFHYKEWKGYFYPEDTPQRKWLSYYAEHFNAVEINATFYKLPKKETLEDWYYKTPDHFRFAIKGSRYITHQKKLKKDDKLLEAIQNFHEGIAPIAPKTGCILWQLPPSQHYDYQKIETFLKELPQDHHHVLEFRHESWFTDEIYDLLAKYGVTLCVISSPDKFPQPVKNTSGAVYIRFHGVNSWYDYDYTNEELDYYADQISAMEFNNIYAFFNNDMHGYAVKNAKMLIEKLEHVQV